MSRPLNLLRPRRLAAFALVAAFALPAIADGKNHLDAALEAAQKGDLDAAIVSAELVPATDPWRADAAFCLAWAHAGKGLQKKAVANYREVVKLRPSDSRAWNNLGVALDELDQLDEALAAYDQSVKLDPKYAPAHNNRGVALDKLGETDRAGAAFQAAIELDPKYAAPHNNLGAWYYETGSRKSAAKHWARAAELDPSYVSPLVNSAVLDFEGDRQMIAEARLLNLVKGGRATAEAWFNLSIFAYKRGDLERALECMETADGMRPAHAETLNNLGVLYFRTNQDRASERALRACIQKDPKMAKAWDNLGLVLYRASRFEEAKESFEKEVALVPTHAPAHYNLGCALAADGKLKEARAAFEKATEMDGAHIEALHNLAVLISDDKTGPDDATKELVILRRIVALNPKYAPAHLSLGRFFQSDPKNRDLRKAYDHYMSYVELEHQDQQTVAEVARTMQAIQDRLAMMR